MRTTRWDEECRQVEVIDKILCDICGKPISLEWGGPHAGFSFTYRPNEEDEITIHADDICDDCYLGEDYDSELHGRVQALAIEIHKLAPHSKVILGPALEASDFGESFKKSVDTSIEEE